MEFSQMYQKRERFTVKIRREISSKGFQNLRSTFLVKAYGFNPLKSARLQYKLQSLQKSVGGETTNIQYINDAIDEILKEVLSCQQEPLHINYDVLSLFKEAYQKIVQLKQRAQRDLNLNSLYHSLQKKIIKLMSCLAYFNLITPQNFIRNYIPHFILQLLNNKHLFKNTLLFLSSVISKDPLKEILIQYHPVLQKLFQQTQRAAENVSNPKSMQTNILMLECWNSLKIQDYTFQNLQTYQSVYIISLYVLTNHEDYNKQSQKGFNTISPLVNALNIIQKYIQYFKEQFTQLPAFANTIGVLMNLLKYDSVALDKCDILRIIHKIISNSQKFTKEIFYKNEYLQILIEFISSSKYNYSTIFVISKLLQIYVNHPNYYQLLQGLVRQYLSNQYLPPDIKGKIWNEIEMWFEEKDHQQKLNDMDIQILYQLSRGKQPFNQSRQCQMWIRIIKMGYYVELPNYIMDLSEYCEDAQTHYNLNYIGRYENY